MVALISSSGDRADSRTFPSGAHAAPSQAEIQRQLEAVAGARHRVVRPPPAAPAASAPTGSPRRQLEAVAGPRYDQPVGIHKVH
jgi:hypothetical protein